MSRFMDKCKVVKVEKPKIFSTWEDQVEIIKADRDYNRSRIIDNSIHQENQILDRGE
jgi:hypothetical protein